MAKYDKKEIKGLENDENLQEMVEDSERLHALKVVLDQEGGRMLVEALLADAMGSVNRLTSGFKDMSHTEMISECALLRTNLSLVQTLSGASAQEKEIDEIIKEAMRS